MMMLQVDISELTAGAEDSGALPRIVGPAKDFVKGSLSSRPFRPGGLDDSHSLGRMLPDGACNGEWVREVLNGGPAQSVAPSFKDGLDLGDLRVILIDMFVIDKLLLQNGSFCVLSNHLMKNNSVSCLSI